MTAPSPAAGAARGPHSRWPLPRATLAGFVAAWLAVIAIAWFSDLALQNRSETAARLAHTLELQQQLQRLLSTLKDAETGQRGYLLTGAEHFLEPYQGAEAAVTAQLEQLRRLTDDDIEQQRQIAVLGPLVAQQLDGLAQTIALRRNGQTDAALDPVRAERGKATMDSVRVAVAAMDREEQLQFSARKAQWEQAAQRSRQVSWGGSALLLVLISVAAAVTAREYRARERESWLRTGLAALVERMQGDQRLDMLGDKVLSFLADFLDAQAGALYVTRSGALQRVATYAQPDSDAGATVASGEGLLGQAYKDRRVLRARELPPGYLQVASSLGSTAAGELLVAPAMAERQVHAVLELGFLRRLGDAEQQLMERIAEPLAVAVRAAKDRARLEELLEETQRQAEELQAQQEELRVSNEELEEQGRVLKESRAQLESQQAELEQTNSQLEEQAQALEHQNDALQRAQAALVDKAAELERSSQVKSEFLANMSHELRTPLNSSLILAGLLADNKPGNLSDEQVKYAQTIAAAGNDLLALINDILDLAKIEAGKVEVEFEPVRIDRLLDALTKTFAPIAAQRGVGFTTTVAPGTPPQLSSDAQRLGQILKNLLSNAFKFTQRGEVALDVSTAADGRLQFAVRDTGIGIAPHQQELIFEAFRQADGSTHRKFGGTGLGLSISRDLARLLGGDIALQSTPGSGSVFTLVLPTEPSADAGTPRGPAEPAPAARRSAGFVPAAATPRAVPPAAAPPKPADQRGASPAAPGQRRILVIEDDRRFAAILCDLTHELGFDCVVTHTGSEGLQAARDEHPNAILLDMNLPDHSGLGVLDQLKRSPATRHIPVHVISVADYSQEARELGAVGYAFKPVQRDELVGVLQRLMDKSTQRLRRVLVVEDDEHQRHAMGQLLGSDNVEIVAVDSAEAALVELQSKTFDCMVMDLSLPDLSGYELLEQMTGQDGVAFPPVIVYTGRSLSAAEEQDLRRFSKSIIIKDARSPERLLDEVTLFLHQVESTLPAESQRLLQAARTRDASFEGRRILVVEDDVRNIFALTAVLEPKGAKVEIARNGREAIDALQRSMGSKADTIDLVLMDIMMPEMDGFEAMRAIRQRADWRKLPIIALTAKAMQDDQEKCLAAGANDYIAKPLNVEKLLSLVRVWMPKP